MAEDVARPLCGCHGEPMVKNGIERRFAESRQTWRCALERRAKARRTHDALEHVAWNKRLLQMRAAHRRWANRRKVEMLRGEV